ncbi:hypothetical protein [Pseudomonas sp. Irchel 3F5]|uniref:hypothetical protein n=1 Tax=Pseudomonas sp. Irchel 3F5 TaxID=2009002 RepID=UPI0011405985|nr:hypothetical protein [Pseudomonas sp. Irchel 3F5]
MSQSSPLFINLQERFKRLESTFLGAQLEAESKDPLTFAVDPDQLAAFRVLVHAEIEDYLERKARESIVQLKAKVSPQTFTIKSNVELFLLASVFGVDLQIKLPYDPRSLHASVQKLIRDIEGFISDNNGIKEGSFVKLSLVCGKMADEIDINLINMLNVYGKERGDVAHQSASRVKTLQAPSTERTNALVLIKALGDFFYPANQQ